MPFKVPSPNELPQTARNAIQALKDYVDGLGKPTDWTAVTFQNGWQNFWVPTHGSASYRKVGDVVWLRGLVNNGTVGQSIFTLPVGFRPSVDVLFAVDSNSAHGRLDVKADGTVVLVAGSNVYVSLNVAFSTL